MAYIDQSTIDEVLLRANIVDIVKEYTDLTKKGGKGGYLGLSPFNDEKSPSFWCYPDLNTYYCFSSGAGGNIITFLQEMENMNYPEIIKFLAKKYQIEIKYEKKRVVDTDFF